MGKKSMKLLSLFLVFILLLLHNKSALGRLSSGGGAYGSEKIRCLERERQALLKFKEALTDDYDRLSSWDSMDMNCCNWSGIRCSNRTGRVVVLNLHYEAIIPPYQALRGRINSSSLLELQHLKYLDLAGNEFEGNIPEFIASFSRLQHLNLSLNYFSGPVPLCLGNLSNLQYLDLRSNGHLSGENLEWLSHLSLLRHLDLTEVNLSKAINWVESVSNLPLLKNLHLYGCNLPDVIPPVDLSNSSSSIAVVDLFHNYVSNSIYSWLFNLSCSSCLIDVNLGFNQLSGLIPNAFGDMTSLAKLNLAINHLAGSIPNSFSNLSHLQSLDLSWNYLSTLPKGIYSLSKLQILDVSYNSLEGIISEAHLSNLAALRTLDLSSNKLILSFNSNWVPPFQLDKIKLSSCKLGPHFPKWLQYQNNFTELDISEAEISDIIPSWFWDLSPGLSYLNLSHNQMKVVCPDLASKFPQVWGIDLSFNCFMGQISPLPPNITYLTLSNNKFSGSMSFLCASTGFPLYYLDLSNNQLSGGLPNCWQLFEQLSVIRLSNNNLSGELPSSLSSLYNLQVLQLPNNNFSGELPKMLKSCTELRILDLRENKITGKIPAWLGTHLTNLVVLFLPSNKFHGSIPFEICHLNHVQILDFSQNDLSGKLPKCFNNFSDLIQNEGSEETTPALPFARIFDDTILDNIYEENAFVQWKGQLREYSKNLILLKIIDLSSNKLSGNIPEQIASLSGLISLNLSRNCLTGKIIKEIGEMKMLEALDLSANGLSGEIPTSLTQLNFLQVLDFSNNNLSGKIPVSTQLQSFDPSAFFGNPQLCGLPLPNKCPGEEAVAEEPPVNTLDKGFQEDEDRFITTGFYISMGLGFFFGFWAIFGTILFSRRQRGAYFKFLENIIDWFYVPIAKRTSTLRRSHL